MVVHSDCMTFLTSLKDNSVDFFCLDPPYFMGDKPFINKKKSYSRVVEEWDNQWKTKSGYIQWCGAWLEEVYRVLKPGGAVIVFGTNHCIHSLYEYITDTKFTMRNFVTWFKPNAMPILWAKQIGVYADSCEYMIYATKGPSVFFGYNDMKQDNGGKQQRNFISEDVIIALNRPQREATGHSTQKPLEVIRYLVRAHCPIGGVVCDLFAGSGTTAIAAFEEGREFVGCEIKKEYTQIANTRIENWLSQKQEKNS